MTGSVPKTTPMPKRKSVLAALAGEVGESVPIWLMRQAGRYLPEYRATRAKAGDFLELCYRPELAVEVTLQPIRRFGFDAAILFADILLVPDALGQRLEYREGEGPKLEPVRNTRDVGRLGRDNLHGRLAPVYETVRELARQLPAEIALIGFAGAPWTVATYMVEGGGSADHAVIKRWAFGDPDGFQKLIDLLVDATCEYLARQIEAGAEAIQIFDTWAGTLPEEAFHRWCVTPVTAIVRNLKARFPQVPVIGFPRGAGVMYDGFAAATDVDGLGLDSTVPAGWAATFLQHQATVQGNLDPQILVVGGAALRHEAERLLATLGHGPYIFNLGHGIVPDTPVEHVAELVRIVKSWRA